MSDKPLFRDVPQFTRASYSVHVFWDYVNKWLEELAELDVRLNSEFQRGHVWTEAQQIAYVEWTWRSPGS